MGDRAMYMYKQCNGNSSQVSQKYISPISFYAVVVSFSNFAKSMAVTLLCSVQN